jgi:hypothetical protein
VSKLWEQDLDKSTKLWQKHVWPLVHGHLGGGDLLRLEGLGEKTAYLLDVHAGIDGFQVHRQNGLRGIAHRAQVTPKPYNTFTVRMARESGAATEFAKRVQAIQSNVGWLYPAITIQAYAQTWDGPVLSVGVAYTSDIMQCVLDGVYAVRQTFARGAATFAAVSWAEMKKNGYRIAVVTPVPAPTAREKQCPLALT